MTIVNIRGTSGSGKSTLVHRMLKDFSHSELYGKFDGWKNSRVISHVIETPLVRTFVIGRYETQCGGCDSLSYKGAFEDIEALIRKFALEGNVLFEGLTVSSVYGRFLKVSQDFPGQFVWCFMDTPEEECYRRIMLRNGGKREPKRDKNGLADYQKKHHGCIIQMNKLLELQERVQILSSDDMGYRKLLQLL